MNFHISRWSPLRPQFSSSSLRSPTSPQQQHHHHDDPTGTLHDTVTSNPNLNHHHNHAAFASPTIEVDGVDTSDDDLKKDHHHITKNNQDDVDTTTDGDEESESDISADDVTQDSRDVLVQRLTDLAEKLSDGNVRTSSIEALHKQVDEMERILKHGDTRISRSRSRHSQQFSSSRKSSSLRPGGGAGGARRPKSLQFVSSTTTTAGNGELSPVSGRGRENNALGIMTGGASPVMSPSWFVSQFQRRPSTHSQQEDKDKIREDLTHSSLSPPTSAVAPSFSASSSRLDEKDELASPRISQQQQHRAASSHHHTSSSAPLATTTTPPEVVEVVKEAEKMCAEMATIIESLQSRRQESDVIPFLPYFGRDHTHTHTPPLSSNSLHPTTLAKQSPLTLFFYLHLASTQNTNTPNPTISSATSTPPPIRRPPTSPNNHMPLYQNQRPRGTRGRPRSRPPPPQSRASGHRGAGVGVYPKARRGPGVGGGDS